MLCPSRTPGCCAASAFRNPRAFSLPHAPLQIHVPLRILKVDADLAFPPRREQILVFFRRFVRSHELRVVGHGVEQ